eukprot:1150812-Pelagomonas_calceolata.AAC.4
MGCTKAEGFGAAQHGGGSCWERGHGKPAHEEELMDPTAPRLKRVQRQVGHKGACCTKPGGQGRAGRASGCGCEG